jgi:chorismate dehydratase
VPTELPTPVRISSVAFFNATPLTFGLDVDPDVRLRHAVPSALLTHLQDDAADVALLPVIDYQRLPDAQIIAAGAIGCDGPTLTVRLFAGQPIGQTSVLAADGDSHTSVVLAQIVLRYRYNVRPRLVPLTGAPDNATRLLIGDKVITDAPNLSCQLDLGQAWKDLTGLPFVFAIWTTRHAERMDTIAEKLTVARERGIEQIEALVEHQAVPRGWPADVARKYLTQYLKFDVGPRQIEAIGTFHAMAAELGLVPSPPQPLRFASGKRRRST